MALGSVLCKQPPTRRAPLRSPRSCWDEAATHPGNSRENCELRPRYEVQRAPERADHPIRLSYLHYLLYVCLGLERDLNIWSWTMRGQDTFCRGWREIAMMNFSEHHRDGWDWGIPHDKFCLPTSILTQRNNAKRSIQPWCAL